MDLDSTYLVATLSDGSIYKIPAKVIFNKMRKDMANSLGMTLREASFTITPDKLEDHQILGYAQALDFHHVMKDAVKLSAKPGIDFKDGWATSHREILSQNQIDSLKIEWEVGHE